MIDRYFRKSGQNGVSVTGQFQKQSQKLVIVAAACAALGLTGGLAGCASEPAIEFTPPVLEPAPKQPLTRASIKKTAPLKYIVKKGDTLWDIANHFLLDPWMWPEVWIINPQVNNPHLIFPGDELYLVWVDGRPQLRFGPGDGSGGRQLERLSPYVRTLDLNQAIPTIPLDKIRHFLNGPRVVTLEEYEKSPYVLEFKGEHLIGATANSIYVMNLPQQQDFKYQVVRLGDTYVDPISNKLLGYEAIPVADTEVRHYGQPSTLRVVDSTREILIGDRLMPHESFEFDATFFPRAPDNKIDSQIISVFDGVSQIGQYSIVTLNRGRNHGLEPGHVLSIFQSGRKVRDPMASTTYDTYVTLPDENAGYLMVFKVEPELSFGLVMKAFRGVHLFDSVRNPQPLSEN